MDNDEKKYPRKKDFMRKSFRPTKKSINDSNFEEKEEVDEEQYKKMEYSLSIDEDIPDIPIEEFPIEAAMHSEPPDMMDIPLQAAVHREPDRILQPSSLPLQAAIHREPEMIVDQNDRTSRIGDIYTRMTTQKKVELQMDEKLKQLNLNLIQKTVKILGDAKSVLVFSGAGISAPSVTFPKVESLNNNVKNAIRNRDYYEILKTEDGILFRDSYLFGSILPILESQPNIGHFAIRDLQKLLEIIGGKVTIITQNLDSLHDLADPESNIIHIHGTLKEGICSKCRKKYDYHTLLNKFKKKPKKVEIFKCDCSGVISPNIIEYGESVREYDTCETKARSSDVILVLGTSLRVTPASELVDIVEKQGKVILFTRSDTPKDNLASLHIRGNLSDILPNLTKDMKIFLQKQESIPKSLRKKIKKYKI
jgi:NAD-dependent deacetylase